MPVALPPDPVAHLSRARVKTELTCLDRESLTVAAPDRSPAPRNRGGRPRATDGLTAVERALRDLDAALVGRECSACGDAAVTFVTPAGGISHGRLKLGEKPGQRAEVLASVTDFRCGMHRQVGRPRRGDGLTSVERADRECDAALRGMVCTVCGADATTARTPAGEPSVAALRLGEAPARRGELLGLLNDPRCSRHVPVGARRKFGAVSAPAYASGQVAAFLSGRVCADPACDRPSAGAISPAGCPNVGELRAGDRLDQMSETFAGAVTFCAAHLAARTAVGVRPGEGADPTVVAHGGAYRLLVALRRAGSVADLESAVGCSMRDLVEVYELLGVDLGRVWGIRPADAVELDGVLAAVALSVSVRDVTRRLRGSANSSGSRRSVVRAARRFGVEVEVFFGHRLHSLR